MDLGAKVPAAPEPRWITPTSMSNPRKTEPMVPPETPAQREDPDFVTAVARAFAVLRCFKRGERALGNKEMALRTGLPRSTIARLTHTLTELGYLEHVPALEKPIDEIRAR